MNAFRKGKGKILQVYVASRVGFKQRSTGTSIPAEARKIERMCAALRDAQEWDLLDRVLADRVGQDRRHRGLTLRDLYAAYSANALPALKARFHDVDLAGQLDGWQAWVISNGGTEQTAATYRAQVDTLVGESLAVSDLTRAKVSKWLTELEDITTGTRRKYLYALKSLVRFLTEIGTIDSDPTAGVRSPKKNPPRLRWETQANDERIVAAAPAEYRALFAFIKATGAELSAALDTLRRDVDLDEALVHIRGSKNDRRNRHDALIDSWALPVLREHCRTLTANAQLWPGISRDQAHHHHQATCKALEIEDYTLRDARHSWAVRCRKRGGSLEAIAEQLGHKSILMAATVYAVFKPTLEERRKTLRMAK